MRYKQVDRKDVETIITEYLKPIFGFALKRCKNLQDAQDLSQEIAIRAFRALLVRDDIADMGKFIWTVAHHMLSNYYRDTAKSIIGVSIDAVAEQIADPESLFDEDGSADELCRLQKEIAYLSRLQRRIVIAYYFEKRRQAEIADMLHIPIGTVKWHLFEAKKELKKGMDTMRNTSELKFNPIKFHSIGINGSSGTKSPDDIFHSALPQNICYCVRRNAMTVNEIADALGVSPVYVESEAKFLEEYGLLKEQNGAYIANFVIDEPTAELLVMQNEMYRKAATLYANDLYDALVSSDILESPNIVCKSTDRNFILWSLIPYIAAWSGEELMENNVSFEEAATLRPDGAHNIFHASVVSENTTLPEDYVYMKNWCGPMWRGVDTRILWRINSEWSNRDNDFQTYSEDAGRVLSLYARDMEHRLSKEDYTWLCEKGYMTTAVNDNGEYQTSWQAVILTNKGIREQLLAIGTHLKKVHQADFDTLKTDYVKAVLDSVPVHLRKIKEYELQFLFYSDGWFLLHCITALLKNGKLKTPTAEQRAYLTTMIINDAF